MAWNPLVYHRNQINKYYNSLSITLSNFIKYSVLYDSMPDLSIAVFSCILGIFTFTFIVVHFPVSICYQLVYRCITIIKCRTEAHFYIKIITEYDFVQFFIYFIDNSVGKSFFRFIGYNNKLITAYSENFGIVFLCRL